MNQPNLPVVEPHPILRSAQISKCGEYRYRLDRAWGNREEIITWIMLNPSTADHEKDDPTIKRVMHFSKAWGFDNCAVMNLYPLRTSKPEECKPFAQWDKCGPDWWARDVIYRNLSMVQDQVHTSQMTVVAWGRHPQDWDPGFVDYIVQDQLHQDVPVDATPPDLWCLGTNQDGSPKHPLARGKHRVPDDQQPIMWSAYR